jgi:hypothetical protein
LFLGRGVFLKRRGVFLLSLNTLIMQKFTVVDFNMHGDGVTALYKDGKKIKEGDYYHDKIEEFINGFKFALDILNIPHKFEKIIAIEENEVAWNIYEYGHEIPLELQEFNKPT